MTPETITVDKALWERAQGALEFLADLRLSSEHEVSDLLYRSPAAELRRRAEQVERRDLEIQEARAVLAVLREKEAG
jgi:hypothetical protein